PALGEPLAGLRGAPRAVDDEIGVEVGRRRAVEDPHAADPITRREQPLDGDAASDADVLELRDPPAHVALEERTAGADDFAFDETRGAVTAGLVPSAVVELEDARSGGDHFGRDTGEE